MGPPIDDSSKYKRKVPAKRAARDIHRLLVPRKEKKTSPISGRTISRSVKTYKAIINTSCATSTTSGVKRTFVTFDNKVKGTSLVSIRGRGIGADDGLAILLNKLGDNARGDMQSQVLTLLQLEREAAGVGRQLLHILQLKVNEGIGIQRSSNRRLGCGSRGGLGLDSGSRGASQLVTVVSIGR